MTLPRMQADVDALPREPSATGGFASDELARLAFSFAEDGYLVFRGVVSMERLSRLRARILEEYERARRSGSIFAGGGQLTGHLNCYPGEESRFVYETLEESGIVDVIKTLSPKVVRRPNVGCNLNLPNSIVQHYHADSNYFVEDFMIANVAVVDTDIANGAIEVAPGTHKKFYQYWRFALEMPYRRSKRIPMKQGDVFVRTSNLWHRGMPNRTVAARPMLAFTWEDGGSHREDPFRVDGGGIAFHPNWYRPNFLGRLRERTYVTVPLSYAAYRFARSLAGNKGYAR